MKKVNVVHTPTMTAYAGSSVAAKAQITTQTSWGSVAASAGGIVGSVTPFLPPPYQWIGGALAALFGVIATKMP